MTTYTFCDPFGATITQDADDIEEAVAIAYEDIDEEETPAYVWWETPSGRRLRVPVPGGVAVPAGEPPVDSARRARWRRELRGYLATAHAGRATSPAKARAARENGQKGGRPPRTVTRRGVYYVTVVDHGGYTREYKTSLRLDGFWCGDQQVEGTAQRSFSSLAAFRRYALSKREE